MGKIDLSDLICERQIQEEPGIGWDQVDRLLVRAHEDLSSAKKVIRFDEAGAMDFVYKAMFHAANALIRSCGYRPGAVRQHQGVIAATGRILGGEAKGLILKFDRLRKRRNQFEYQGIFEMGSQELADSVKQAEEFLVSIKNVLEEKDPQKRFTGL